MSNKKQQQEKMDVSRKKMNGIRLMKRIFFLETLFRNAKKMMMMIMKETEKN